MKVELLAFTTGAKDLLIFTKQTRRMDGMESLCEIEDMDDEEKSKELDYIFSTISGPWEFIDYIFFISGVTRAFTHQMVRHRVGTSFSQESLRIADKRDFQFLDETNGNPLFVETMKVVEENYRLMIDSGVDIQKARGILPTNILTNITVKFNLRSLNTLMNTRLCVRTQGEFQNVAKLMRQQVLGVHPWAEPALLPFCLEWGSCKFPRFEKCPIKKKHKWLQKDKELVAEAKATWEKLNFSPQPK